MTAMISLEEARDIVKAQVKPGAVETVPLREAVGRVLAADVTSDIDVTPFDDSAMDGFALQSADLEGAAPASPIALRCIAHLGAGDHYDAQLASGQCVRIMTGAPVPPGADTVVKFEIVSWEGEGTTGDAITFTAPSAPGANIRKAGQEAKAGEVCMKAGTVINAGGAGKLASTGNVEVAVYARPKVGLISIGSELVDAAEVPGPGMIRNSARYSIASAIEGAGGIPVVYPAVADDSASIEAAFVKALEECDALVSTGGACMGDYDLTPAILDKLGCVHFTRVNIKPGKSQPFGMVGNKPVFVLSGNPAASAVGCELYVRLALRVMQGYTKLDRLVVKAAIDADMKKKDPRVFLQRGRLWAAEDGSLSVRSAGNQSSGLFGSLQEANCLYVVPAGTEPVCAGDMLECILTGIPEDAI